MHRLELVNVVAIESKPNYKLSIVIVHVVCCWLAWQLGMQHYHAIQLLSIPVLYI